MALEIFGEKKIFVWENLWYEFNHIAFSNDTLYSGNSD